MKTRHIAAALLLSAAPVQAAVIDSFTLDMTGFASEAGVDSAAVLAAGTSYEITVSGTFDIGCTGFGPAVQDCPTDAEYYTPLSGGNAGNHYTLSGYDTGVYDIGARVDGVKLDWGPYNDTHVYTALFTATGPTVNVSYLDVPGAYGDNVGSLQVSISTINGNVGQVPLPAGLPLGLTALAALGLVRVRGRNRR